MLRFPMLLLMFVLLLPATMWAQLDRGTITGLVADATGAVVPDVEVSVIDTATNIRTATRTGATGNYVIMRLAIGTYTLTARKEGFKTFEQTGIPVRVGETMRLDISLTVGGVTETVAVTGQAPLLQSESAEIGSTISSEQFTELPLTLGGGIRQPSRFIVLSPGVTYGGRVAGGPSGQRQIYYDGVPQVRGGNNEDGEISPSVDAIAEFKLITSNYSAEYAHGLAGVTTFTIKSGTNELHGTAFFFNSIEKFNARSFFQTSRPPYKQNNWGFSVGGPVLIPKIYDGRNRTFWFFNTDQFYRRQPGAPGPDTIPTSNMLNNGDFSEWAAAGQGNIYDPKTGRYDSSGKYVRDMFPGNVVPKERWSRVAKNYLPYHPQPHRAGITFNYFPPGRQPWSDQQTGATKVDHQFTPAHRISGMFNYTDRPRFECQRTTLEGPLNGYALQHLTTRLGRATYDWVLSPTVLNHIGAGYTRFRNPMSVTNFGQGWPAKLGLTGMAADMMPQVTFSHDYVGFATFDHYDWAMESFVLMDTLSMIRNSHTIKFGFEIDALRNNIKNWQWAGGDFTFDQRSTGLPGVAKSGNAFASFLLGDVYSGRAYFPLYHDGNRTKYYNLWINDDWKVTTNLTLNLGVRWEVRPPFSDPNDRLSWMDPDLPNPGAGNLKGAYSFIGTGQGRNGLKRVGDTHWRDISPRIGIAYRFTSKTVVRTGFGMFYALPPSFTGMAGVTGQGFNAFPTFASGDNGITPGFNWDGGFPQNFKKPPLIDPTFQNGQSATVNIRDRVGTMPYTMQSNLTLERQIGQAFSVSGGYVMYLGRRLYGTIDLNQVDPKYLGLKSALTRRIKDPVVAGLGYQAPFPEFTTLWGSRDTLVQALRPFPMYSGAGQNLSRAPYFNSSYHSFQAKAEMRRMHGLNFTVAYTGSKYLANTGGTRDYYNRKLDWGYEGADAPHILTFSYIYELPMGKGKPFLAGNPILDKVVGGWTISGIHSYSSGNPIAVNVTNTLPIFNPANYPNVLSNDFAVKPKSGEFDPAVDVYLNPGAFALPADFTFGNAPVRLNFRAPYSKNESIALLKDTGWLERYKLQFRMEVSNPVNRVVFGSPAGRVGSTTFGVISSASAGRQMQFGLKLQF